MVDLGSHLPRPMAHGLSMPHARDQRAFWLGYDVTLALLVLAGAGDMPNRWGVANLVWLLAYLLAVLRILTLWPAFFRLLGRNWQYLVYPAVCAMSVVWSVARPTTLVGAVQIADELLDKGGIAAANVATAQSMFGLQMFVKLDNDHVISIGKSDIAKFRAAKRGNADTAE